jgi:hypothetical protein
MHTIDQLRSGQLAGIQRLNLSCGLEHFPAEIMQLADTLEVLDLSGNALSTLPDDLPRLKKLRVLFCSNNAFHTLPPVLGSCQALSMIGFKANRIHSVPAAALPHTLRWLILTDNRIAALPDEIGNCSQLQKLMLAGNQLQKLPASLSNCTRLELLRIAANQLSSLPAWLLQLPRLAWLAYAGNRFCQAAEAETLTNGQIADIPWEQLDPAQQLGEGASGTIHQASYQPPAGHRQQVAVKLFKGEVTSDGWPLSEMAASIHAGQHPNLISVIGKTSQHPAERNALIMPLIEREFSNLAAPPSLDSCTRDVYPPGCRFDLPSLLQIAHGVASAAGHLHQQGIMHGDLYGHNILYSDQGRALIGDFGAASFYAASDKNLADGLQKIEVRAFGCLLEELLARCQTREDASEIGHQLDDLTSACLSEEIGLRPLFAQIEARLQQMIQSIATPR